jgi:hypothetical protein
MIFEQQNSKVQGEFIANFKMIFRQNSKQESKQDLKKDLKVLTNEEFLRF